MDSVSWIFSLLLSIQQTSILWGESVVERDEPKIVGGIEGDKQLHPYVVSLRTANNNHFCGGTIIDHQHVVTAAHCIIKGHAKYVVVGSDSLDHGGTKYPILSTQMHPEYDNKTFRNDIAIVKIGEKMSYALDFPKRMEHDLQDLQQECLVMGWGLTQAGGHLSNKFKIASVKPVAREVCAEEWKELYNPQLICTSSKGNAACNGDSGGPLICEGKFAGVVSFGKPCATGKPDMFTAVHFYNDWINGTVHS